METAVLPFAEEHLDGAAALLVARHRRDRSREPSLPERYESIPQARAALCTLWSASRAGGMVAVRRGRITGYLLGAPVDGTPRPRSWWIPYAGHATVEDEAVDVTRVLYAAAASAWIADGRLTHYALIPASDRTARAALASLGFGAEQTHAVRSTDPLPGAEHRPGISIRQGSLSDRDAVLRLAMMLPRHGARSPVFGSVSPEMLTKIGEGHTSLLQGTDHIYWLAVRAGVVVAFQLYTSLAGSSDLLTPDGATDLVIGVTDPATRQSGVARHLLAHALGQARNRDERWCVADWRTANVEAAHAWLRSGFRPAAYRLVRTVDSRVPWAQR